jgi:hypothetical protein
MSIDSVFRSIQQYAKKISRDWVEGALDSRLKLARMTFLGHTRHSCHPECVHTAKALLKEQETQLSERKPDAFRAAVEECGF